jgi:hypothetical protein
MAVGFEVANVVDEIGTHDFLHAFFSTISHHLEPKGWGTKYPELMNELYQGRLDRRHAEKALDDIREVRERLKAFPPRAVIWDIENLNARPPWGNNLSADITDLSNYFVTSTGRDLFEVTIECLEALASEGESMRIVQV